MNSPQKLTRLLCLAVLALALPWAASAADWAHKKKLSLDTTAAGADIKDEVAQLPLLVRLHSGNFTFSQAKPDGADLRFFAADGKTPLKYHIESYDAPNELASVWVALPKLAPNAKAEAVTLAWGNDKAVSESDGKTAYDAAQVFVLHFSDAEGVKDATANANDARASTAKAVAAGQMGGGLAFDGKSRVDLQASTSMKLQAAAGFSFTAWIKPTAVDKGTLFALPAAGKGVSIGLVDGKLAVMAGSARVVASTALTAGNWQHVAVVAGGSKASLYVDGNEVGSGSLTLSDASGDAVIGADYNGELDEVALAAVARSPAYVRALAISQAADTPLLAVVDDSGGGEGASYFAILIGSVTIDGWVVIGLLTVMAVVSFYVMISKALMLRVATRSNAAFLTAFQDKSTELLTPGHADIATVREDAASQRSAVFRLYQIGLAEVSKRFAVQDKAGLPHRLSGASLEAIRASLDASMLRENQRFNSGMVLLTIAISGGPFLGLLGTVVGVMITFAAIAAAGEVNVNSIAPGIAAALVATVAGLGVAIPALFGYNWLASQIKNLSNDCQVFVDEFVTKTAELHTDG